MREFTYDLTEHLQGGLRPFDDGRIDQPFLTEQKNVLQKAQGLVPFEKPTLPLTNLPQIVREENFLSSDFWTVEAGWVIAGGKLTGTATSNKAYQDLNSGIRDDITYLCHIKLDNVTGGSVLVTVAGAPEVEFDTDGTHAFGVSPEYLDPALSTLLTITGDNFTGEVSGIDATPFYDLSGFLTFPFPLIYKGSRKTVVVMTNFEDKAGRVYEYDTGSYTEIITYTPDGTYTEFTPSENAFFLDMYNKWYLISDQGALCYLETDAISFASNKGYFTTDLKARSGCIHKGRIVLGGFTSFWSDRWLDFFDQLKERMPSGFMPSNSDFDTATLFWSGINEGILWLLFEEIGMYGYLPNDVTKDLDDPYLFDMFRKNDLGWAPLPFDGAICDIKELGDGLVIYGNTAIFYAKTVLEPTSTLAYKKIADIGVRGQNSVVGDGSVHYFLDRELSLWKISQELQVQRLGFNEFFSGLTGTKSTLVNPVEREYFISESNESLVISRDKPATLDYAVGSGYFTNNFKAVYEAISGADENLVVVSDTFDIDIRGIKTITSVEMGIRGDSNTTYQVAIDYRYNKTDSFTRSSFKRLNNEGWVTFPISGLEFRLVIKADDYTNTFISYAKIHYSVTDKRNVRGI